VKALVFHRKRFCGGILDLDFIPFKDHQKNKAFSRVGKFMCRQADRFGLSPRRLRGSSKSEDAWPNNALGPIRHLAYAPLIG
jgi:hypothetical protein